MGGPVTMDEEQEVMTAMKVAGWDTKQIRSLTYTSWKDGIDIERPTTALLAFARLIRAGNASAPADSSLSKTEGKPDGHR